jgi:putative transposase
MDDPADVYVPANPTDPAFYQLTKEPMINTIPMQSHPNWYTHNYWDIKLETATVPTTVIRAKKVRLLPNAVQGRKLMVWLDIYYKVYNIALSHFEQTGRRLSAYSLRNETRALLPARLYKVAKSVGMPFQCISEACIDVHKAHKAALALNGNNRFRMRYKKDGCQSSMSIEKTAITPTGIAVKSLGIMACVDFNLADVDAACRLKRENNKFYLYVPMKKQQSVKLEEDRCGLDPGVRTFQTAYVEGGITYDIGCNYGETIKPILKKIDCVSHIPAARKFVQRLYNRIRNLTTDMHWKVISWLTAKHSVICIGKMSTSDIVKNKPGHYLHPMSKRLMLLQSHYTFRMRLKSACEEKGVRLIEVDERYTSKTCGRCRAVHPNLGSNKVYDCIYCGYHADRDANAARNIYLRGLTGRMD